MLEASEYKAKITCIDRWDTERSTGVLPIFINNILQIKANDNIHIIALPSSEAISTLEDNSYDLIFIDGDHNYQPCYNDISDSILKLSIGGVLCGHDYNNLPEVTKAVNDYFSNTNFNVEYHKEYIWCVRGLK